MFQSWSHLAKVILGIMIGLTVAAFFISQLPNVFFIVAAIAVIAIVWNEI